MRKAWIAGALALGSVVLISGCVSENDKTSIESYVKDELGSGKFVISDSYEESVDEEGYTDKIWTVTDEENDITFHVIDDYHWGMESMTNTLGNDYEASVFLKYQDQFPESALVEEGRITITAGQNSQGMNEVSMEAFYADRTELGSIFDQLTVYRGFFHSLGFDAVDPEIHIQYEGPESFPCKGHMIGGDIFVNLTSDMDQSFDQAMDKYISAGLDYRLEEVLSDTTEEERQEVILADQTNRVGIVREDGEAEYYDDLIGNEYCYGLSVSTLYQVLEREGLNPEGDERHFTCPGTDGSTYEFSCDFGTEDFDGDEGAYYLADGLPVQLGYAYNIHIRAAEASKLFGIDIVTEWNQTIAEN